MYFFWYKNIIFGLRFLFFFSLTRQKNERKKPNKATPLHCVCGSKKRICEGAVKRIKKRRKKTAHNEINWRKIFFPCELHEQCEHVYFDLFQVIFLSFSTITIFLFLPVHIFTQNIRFVFSHHPFLVCWLLFYLSVGVIETLYKPAPGGRFTWWMYYNKTKFHCSSVLW